MSDYDWLKSEYGGEVHGFAPAVEGRDYREALCEHSAPASKLHPHTRTDRMCVACLILYGEQIPEDRPQPI